MKKIFILSVCHLLLICFSIKSVAVPLKDSTTLTIRFINKANGKEIMFDSLYSTPSGEKYSISKLKYYISDIQLSQNKKLSERDNFHLINQAGETSFTIPVKPGKYDQLSFLVGIDSIHNCSGAQTGALDPMNDMFWTWNSGYVMFKLEGTSPQSSADKNRIEHHIGGYRFNNNVATKITIGFPWNELLWIGKNENKKLTIICDLDKYWQSANTISLKEIPVCTLPGALAKTIATNFSFMFSASFDTK